MKTEQQIKNRIFELKERIHDIVFSFDSDGSVTGINCFKSLDEAIEEIEIEIKALEWVLDEL